MPLLWLTPLPLFFMIMSPLLKLHEDLSYSLGKSNGPLFVRVAAMRKAEEVTMIQFQIAKLQKKLLEAAAKRQGLSLSAWIRQSLLRVAREQARESGK